MKKNFDMTKGDTLTFTFEIENLTETLDSCYFSCKKNVSDEEYTFQKSLNDGIERTENNKYIVRVAPSDTRDINSGTYVYDLQVRINDDIYTIMSGNIYIDEEVTKETV